MYLLTPKACSHAGYGGNTPSRGFEDGQIELLVFFFFFREHPEIMYSTRYMRGRYRFCNEFNQRILLQLV